MPGMMRTLLLVAGLTLATSPLPRGPVAPPDSAGGPAAHAITRLLARAIDVPVDSIAIVETHGCVWPDAALGLGRPGEQYSPLHTPGYRIRVRARGVTYEYRTDRTASLVRTESGPLPAPPALVLEWVRAPGETLRVDAAGQVSGRVGRHRARFALTPDERWVINHWRGLSSPIDDAGARDGLRLLAGIGSRALAPEERRAVRETMDGACARTLPLDVIARRDLAGADRTSDREPLLAWHREGGIAGFCDDLVVMRGGLAAIASCRTAHAVRDTVWLAASDLAQVYAWSDSMGQTVVLHADPPGVRDRLQVVFTLQGSGRRAAAEAEKAAIEAWAAHLVATQRKEN